jgi:hypothetical protein
MSKANDDTVEPLVRLRNSMILLKITGDTLFDRIRTDLERGLLDEARMHLNFVDVMVKPNAEAHASATKEPIA